MKQILQLAMSIEIGRQRLKSKKTITNIIGAQLDLQEPLQELDMTRMLRNCWPDIYIDTDRYIDIYV